MTTNERKADALLEAAKRWQNDKTADECGLLTEEIWEEESPLMSWFDILAGLALSEVAGMGFDLINADDSECEKIALMFRAALETAPTGHAYGYVSNLRIGRKR